MSGKSHDLISTSLYYVSKHATRERIKSQLNCHVTFRRQLHHSILSSPYYQLLITLNPFSFFFILLVMTLFSLVLFFFFFFQGQPTNSMGSEHLKTTRSCMDTPMNMYSSKGHIKRLTGAFFLADIQTMTYTQVHRYLGHASMFLLTLHQTITVCG